MKRTQYIIIPMLLMIIILSIITLSTHYFTNYEKPEVKQIHSRTNNVYKLAHPPLNPLIGNKNLINTENDDQVTLVSWVNTGRSIDLGDAKQKLENTGFYTTEINDNYVEAVRRYACFPHLTTDINWPGLTINVRVYSNGTIVSYVTVASDGASLLMYLDNTLQYPIPITMKAVYDVLDALQLSSYKDYVLNGMPSHPEAKYLGVIWSSHGWGGSTISGEYYINEDALFGAWIAMYKYDWSYWRHKFLIDGYTYYDTGGDVDDTWGKGLINSEHLAKGKHTVYCTYGGSGGSVFFLIIIVFK